MSFSAEKRCVKHNKTEIRGYKKSPLERLRQGAVSDKCPVLTGHGRESERRSELHRYDSASGHIKRRGPPPTGQGAREPQAACTDRPWRRERNEVERYI